MAEKIALTAAPREVTGKKTRSLRKVGIVPGVMYGAKLAATNVQFEPVPLAKVIAKAGRHSSIEIDLDGKKHTAIIKDIEYAPARNDIVHVSLQAVSADEQVTTEVPLVLTHVEESLANKAGLLIVPTIEEVEVRAKAADLPRNLEADASQLAQAEEKLTLADLVLPAGVEILDLAPEQVIATVWEPAALAARNAAADEAAAETPETEVENGAATETEAADATSDQPE
ncbi:MAG: 50S ribosomal protein L25 [Candidatus Nanoperiomorbaceae bacterium]